VQEQSIVEVEFVPTLLEDAFDPRVLEAGLYRAYSNTPAFPVLWSMTLTGEAVLGGYKYHQGGVVEMLAGVDVVGVAEANPEDEGIKSFQATVVIPHEAFTSIPEEEYGDTTWQQMWWREVIQNAIDAGAKSIDCTIVEQPDGTWLAKCSDDGHGMNVNDILDLFFTLKKTRKHGESSIGGFGEAKKFIALAWLYFSVRSQDAKVYGSGESWPNLNASSGHEMVRGTTIEVVMPADKHTTEAAAIDFITKCYLPGVEFTVNGNRFKAAMKPKQFKKDLPFGSKLYYDKSGTANAALVRANGLYMFTKDLPSDFRGTIFIELSPKRDEFPTPKDLFNATRMDLRYNDLGESVRNFLQKARADVREALRDQEELVRTEYKGLGLFSVDRQQAAMIRDVAGELPEIKKGNTARMTEVRQEDLCKLVEEFYKEAFKKAKGDETKLIGVTDRGIAEILAGIDFSGESHLEAATNQIVWKPDFIIMNDETMRDRFKIDKRFEPQTMSGPVLALAKCWAEIVRLIFVATGTKAQWGVGFVFSTEAMGIYHKQDYESRYICINPFDLETKKLLSIREEKQLSKVFAIAVHECAHYIDGCDYHSEGWRVSVDKLMDAMMRYWPQVKRIASSIKMRRSEEAASEQRAPIADAQVMWLTRGLQQCLVVYPGDEQEKQISRDYLIPIPELGQVHMFLYDDEANEFLSQSATGDYLVKLLELESGFMNQVKVDRRRMEEIARDSYSPVEGKARSWQEHDLIPISLATRKDGLVAMRPSDRQIIRDLKSYDRTMSSLIFVGAQYRGRESEELLDTIIRQSSHPLPFASDDDQVKDMILQGRPVVLAYSANRYADLLNSYHEWRGSADDDTALSRTIANVDIRSYEKVLVDVYFPHGRTDRIKVLVTQSRDTTWYRWTYGLERLEPVEIVIKEPWEIERIMSVLGDEVKRRLESVSSYRDYEMDRDFFERLLEFHLDSFAPI
jgi:hypothetical protein